MADNFDNSHHFLNVEVNYEQSSVFNISNGHVFCHTANSERQVRNTLHTMNRASSHQNFCEQNELDKDIVESNRRI